MDHVEIDPQRLRQVPLFSDLGAAEAEELRLLFEPFAVGAGDTLFRHGDPADRFFLVDRGELEIASRTPGDSRLRFFTAGPRSVLGEGALNQATTRAGSARAGHEPVHGWALRTLAFRGLLRAHRSRFWIPRTGGR